MKNENVWRTNKGRALEKQIKKKLGEIYKRREKERNKKQTKKARENELQRKNTNEIKR